MADGGRRRDGGDDGVELPAVLGLEGPDRVEVLALVRPLLQLGVPDVVDVQLGEGGVDQVGEVGDGGLARLFEDVEYVLGSGLA